MSEGLTDTACMHKDACISISSNPDAQQAGGKDEEDEADLETLASMLEEDTGLNSRVLDFVVVLFLLGIIN